MVEILETDFLDATVFFIGTFAFSSPASAAAFARVSRAVPEFSSFSLLRVRPRIVRACPESVLLHAFGEVKCMQARAHGVASD